MTAAVGSITSGTGSKDGKKKLKETTFLTAITELLMSE